MIDLRSDDARRNRTIQYTACAGEMMMTEREIASFARQQYFYYYYYYYYIIIDFVRALLVR